jgi:uncharacterized membrane protein YvbJ
MSASRFLQGQGSFVKKQMLNMKRQHRSLQKKATIPMTMEVVIAIVIVIVMMMTGGIKPHRTRKTTAASMATTAATTTTQKNAAK